MPVNFRCAQAEHMPYPFQAHMDANSVSEGEKAVMSDSQAQAFSWLSGAELMRSASGHRMFELPHDINRCFLPMGIVVSQAYNLPGLADTDVIGLTHYQKNSQRCAELLYADLTGAVEPKKLREGDAHHWRTYTEEDDYQGNPQSYAGHFMNWYGGTGDEFSHNTKARVERDVQLMGLGESVKDWKDTLMQKEGHINKYAEFRRLRRRELTEFEPANIHNGPSPFADDYEVSNRSRMGTVSPFHQAALSPLIMRFQVRNCMVCMIRATCKLLGVLMLVILLTVTRHQLFWAIEAHNLKPTLLVNEFLVASVIAYPRWILILLHIVVDV